MGLEQLLKNLGYSSILIAIICLMVLGLRELWSIYKNQKIKDAQSTMLAIVTELDDKISNFYLPLRERFIVSKHIFESTLKFGKMYENEGEIIQGGEKGALREIFVNRVFLPINNEIKNIICDKLHLKDESDETNYEHILHHYIVWSALEDAKNDKIIEKYNATEFLKFPSIEVDKCISMCNRLLEHRNKQRMEMLSFIGFPHLFDNKRQKGGKRMKLEKIEFQKSSFSSNYHPTCIGVARVDDKILVADTNTKKDIVQFTTEEWGAFIKGVKAGEFDKYAEK